MRLTEPFWALGELGYQKTWPLPPAPPWNQGVLAPSLANLKTDTHRPQRVFLERVLLWIDGSLREERAELLEGKVAARKGNAMELPIWGSFKGLGQKLR